jgi:transposase-like protein
MKPKTRPPVSLERTPGHRKWPPEVRLQMAQAVVDRGMSKATVSEAFGIPATTVAE